MKVKFPIILILVLLCVSATIVKRAPARSAARGVTWSGNSGKPVTPEPQGTDRDRAIAELRKRIAGQEKKPSGEVYKNIKNFKNLPAGQLPNVMNAFSRALGVSCDHCHAVASGWESEDKPQKQIAREMMAMAGTINSTLLKGIKNLTSATPEVSCSTCHRGQVVPDKKLPGS